MTTRTFLACGLAALCLTLGASRADARRAAAPQVMVEILDAGPTVPACGRAIFIVAMRVRVIESTRRGGPREDQEILVGVSCPTGTGLYRVGARARMRLTRRRPWRTGTLMPNADGSTPRPRWWAMHTEPLPPPPG